MAIPIPNPLVEFILLGPMDDRRQLQDSPILGDVWVEFGKEPSKPLDLLIAPYRGKHAGEVAGQIEDGLEHGDDDRANIAYLQGLVVARLTFEEVMRVVVTKTKWWIDKWDKGGGREANEAPTHEMSRYVDGVDEIVTEVIQSATAWHEKTRVPGGKGLPPIERFVALTGLILWAARQKRPKKIDDVTAYIVNKAKAKEITPLLRKLTHDMLAESLRDLKEKHESLKRPGSPTPEPGPLDMSDEALRESLMLVWQVSLNRAAMPAIIKSVPAVKADAAKTLFSVNCKDIAWAVIDSGIAGDHVAFLDAKGNSRVQRSFDFKNFRRIVSLSNSKESIRKANVDRLAGDQDLLHPPGKTEAAAALERLADDARNRGPIHWDLVEQFVEVKPATSPVSDHGTHVAGILGASRGAGEQAASGDLADGMCPDISLYDFRVLGQDLRETEFAIIAALQFIRYLNTRDNFLTIHGANLSLSIPHDVRNFACGRTPICDECERLVESGVVVVAAAGNHGYKSFETKDGAYDSYAAFSITDPGNADCVITVGSTHRFWPHTYGVSFFSSRGPTGDGRIKPDLVAPGERIRAPVLVGWGDLDGTSMAAPHVSGAAAMLMARYSELIGRPRRIKQILCESATDLGRERSFQGNGMLDVLRAFQSI